MSEVNGAFLFCFFPLTSILFSVFIRSRNSRGMARVAEKEGKRLILILALLGSPACRRLERGLFPLLCAKAELCAQNEMASSLAPSRPSLGWRSEGARPCLSAPLSFHGMIQIFGLLVCILSWHESDCRPRGKQCSGGGGGSFVSDPIFHFWLVKSCAVRPFVRNNLQTKEIEPSERARE